MKQASEQGVLRVSLSPRMSRRDERCGRSSTEHSGERATARHSKEGHEDHQLCPDKSRTLAAPSGWSLLSPRGTPVQHAGLRWPSVLALALTHVSPQQAVPYLRRMLEPPCMGPLEALRPGQRAGAADVAKQGAAGPECAPVAPEPPDMQHPAPGQPLGAPPAPPLAEMQEAGGGISAEPGLRVA